MLASLAGRTVVTTAVTDAWQSARYSFAGLLGRGDAEQAEVAGHRLDRTRAQLTGATSAEVARIRAALEAQWTTRFADLLDDDPDAASGLLVLIAEIGALLPTVVAAEHGVTAGHDVSIKADGGGVAAGVIHGNVTPPGPTLPTIEQPSATGDRFNPQPCNERQQLTVQEPAERPMTGKPI